MGSYLNKNMKKNLNTCEYCKYKAHLVGVGQGIRCSNPKNKNRIFVGETKRSLPIIPGLDKSCEFWIKMEVSV